MIINPLQDKIYISKDILAVKTERIPIILLNLATRKKTQNSYILMKKLLYLSLLLMCIGCSVDKTPREGDIIFQTKFSQEGQFFKTISGSDINHCGIVVMKNDSTLHVLHMDDRMRLTPLSNFVQHGHQNKFSIRRATNKKVKIDYKKYMKSLKDNRLRLDDNQYYNSELVYRIYKEDLGIELCKPRPISEYNIAGIDTTLMQQGFRLQQEIITPADIYNSRRLKTVQSRFDEKKKNKK